MSKQSNQPSQNQPFNLALPQQQNTQGSPQQPRAVSAQNPLATHYQNLIYQQMMNNGGMQLQQAIATGHFTALRNQTMNRSQQQQTSSANARPPTMQLSSQIPALQQKLRNPSLSKEEREKVTQELHLALTLQNYSTPGPGTNMTSPGVNLTPNFASGSGATVTPGQMSRTALSTPRTNSTPLPAAVSSTVKKPTPNSAFSTRPSPLPPVGAKKSSIPSLTQPHPEHLLPRSNSFGPNDLMGSSLAAGSNVSPGMPSMNVEQPNMVLGKRKLADLVSQIDPHETIEDDAVDIILQMTDEFIESVTNFACKLAKHRKSDTLEVKDLQLHLERNYNIRIPGFFTTTAESIDLSISRKRPNMIHTHQQRLAVVRKAQFDEASRREKEREREKA